MLNTCTNDSYFSHILSYKVFIYKRLQEMIIIVSNKTESKRSSKNRIYMRVLVEGALHCYIISLLSPFFSIMNVFANYSEFLYLITQLISIQDCFIYFSLFFVLLLFILYFLVYISILLTPFRPSFMIDLT